MKYLVFDMKTELFETLEDFKSWQQMMSLENEDQKYFINHIKAPVKFPAIMIWYFQPWDEDNDDEYHYKYIYKDSFDRMKRFKFEYHNPFNIIVK